MTKQLNVVDHKSNYLKPLFHPRVPSSWDNIGVRRLPSSVFWARGRAPRQEVFTDVTAGDRYEEDLLVQAQFQNRSSYFLIHLENQSYNQADFNN